MEEKLVICLLWNILKRKKMSSSFVSESGDIYLELPVLSLQSQSLIQERWKF